MKEKNSQQVSEKIEINFGKFSVGDLQTHNSREL